MTSAMIPRSMMMSMPGIVPGPPDAYPLLALRGIRCDLLRARVATCVGRIVADLLAAPHAPRVVEQVVVAVAAEVVLLVRQADLQERPLAARRRDDRRGMDHRRVEPVDRARLAVLDADGPPAAARVAHA